MSSKEDNTQFAGFWSRFIAFNIDLTIFTLPICLLGTLIILFCSYQNINLPFNYNIFLLLLPLIYLGYFTASNSNTKQATFGKVACNIYVSQINKSKISHKSSFFRTIVVFIVFIPNLLDTFLTVSPYITWVVFVVVAFCFGMAGFTKNKTAFHDLIFKTRVHRGTPNQIQTDKTTEAPHFVILSLFLFTFSSFLPLFTTKDKSLLFFVFSSIYTFLLVSYLSYIKNRNFEKHQIYSFKASKPFIKKYAVIVTPSLILIALNYMAIFLIQTKTS
ncbi:RDD family protein [Desulfoluna spongiiphila]|uniref:Uncharacterized membrane protein YckC, RDD family n=1 Tax=Desulfoluna spongiiphila TaxID=419481 RepID=A0A1G5H0H1_9BACT|nr:RDD family protein [Desulfoluna spongiiphila]SCY56860.1 Uncharacterized membrane protein YckC, RDD family [Desulfoluna spongiiphila]